MLLLLRGSSVHNFKINPLGMVHRRFFISNGRKVTIDRNISVLHCGNFVDGFRSFDRQCRMKAFILENNRVQIGNKIFHTISGHVENSQNNRTGLEKEAIACVQVPTKNLEFARIALDLGIQKLYKEARHARS